MRLRIQRDLRRWHRWLAVAVAIQLLAWTVSGVFFALVDIEGVRGTPHRQAVADANITTQSIDWVESPAQKIVLRNRLPNETVVGVYRQQGADWFTLAGHPLTTLSKDEALLLGQQLTDLAPNEAVWIDTAVEGSEYRGADLPLWRVYATHEPSTVAYLDALTGEVTAIRNTSWRWWDFLWSLHIMDYGDRDTIGTWLLKIFSVLGLASALAGIALFISLPNKWR